MASSAETARLVAENRRAFAARVGRAPAWTALAPGRVNLIGEHTDYNDGFVFPMAIDRYTVVSAAPREDTAGDAVPGGASGGPVLRLLSLAMDQVVDVPLGPTLAPGEPAWANYVRGVVAGFLARGTPVPALDLIVSSNVPLGGGLSSSASLEVATATLLDAVTGAGLAPVDKARLCQKAEHDFAGVPCGLMDQLASTLGDAAGALLIDCRTQSARVVPFSDPAVSVLICNTNVKHALGDGEYARRRAQCHAAASALGQASLRDVSLAALEAGRERMEEVAFRRARHVLTENQRTLAAADALERRDFAAAGDLMYQSHESLRVDFEVSCAELDAVVADAAAIGVAGGVFGARMTGGGFGGCTVALVATGAVATVTERLARAYRERFNRDLTPFVTPPAQGAHLADPAERTG